MTTATELKTLDKSGALKMLEAAVAAKGREYRYSTDFGEGADCEYARHTPEEDEAIEFGKLPWDTTPPHPACIVGVGLHDGLHISVADIADLSDALPDMAGYRAEYPDSNRVWNALNREDKVSAIATVKLTKTFEDDADIEISDAGLRCTEAAARVLWIAQTVQDADCTWGEALDAAYAVAKLVEGE